MRQKNASAIYDYLSDDLCELQREWEGKVEYFQQQGQDLWVRAVLFGIETGRNRIAERSASSLVELKELFEEWERIGRLAQFGAITASTGVDFGIKLVIDRARSGLRRSALRQFRLPKT